MNKALKLVSQLGALSIAGAALAGHAGLAPAFNGPYIGVSTSLVSPNDTLRVDGDGVRFNGGTVRWGAGAFAGYGHTFSNSFYLGGHLLYGTTFGRSNIGQFYDEDDGATHRVSVESKNSLGFAFTPGYLLSDRVMANLILGVENTQYRLRITDSQGPDVSASSREWGWFPGVGVQYAATQNWHVGLNYTYHISQGFKKTFTDGSDTDTYRLSPRRSIVQLTVSYTF